MLTGISKLCGLACETSLFFFWFPKTSCLLLYRAEKNLLEVNNSGDLLDCLCFISGGNNLCGFVVSARSSASAVGPVGGGSGIVLLSIVLYIFVTLMNAS